jgi:hypothetical protein
MQSPLLGTESLITYGAGSLMQADSFKVKYMVFTMDEVMS